MLCLAINLEINSDHHSRCWTGIKKKEVFIPALMQNSSVTLASHMPAWYPSFLRGKEGQG